MPQPRSARSQPSAPRRRWPAVLALCLAAGTASAEAGPAEPAPAPGGVVAAAGTPASGTLLAKLRFGPERAPAEDVLASLPSCERFRPAGEAAAEFRSRIHALCTAVADRMAEGAADTLVAVYAALRLRAYEEALRDLEARRGAAPGAATADASAYLIARQLELFRLHRAIGAPEG